MASTTRPVGETMAIEYNHDRQEALAALNSKPSNNGAILLGIVVIFGIALLLLVYFILFLCNRLKNPDNELEDTEGAIAGDTRKSGIRNEGQNTLILTREDLQIRTYQHQKERPDSDKFYHSNDQERAEPTAQQAAGRNVHSDVQSEQSSASADSWRKRQDLSPKQHPGGVTEDGIVKQNHPSIHQSFGEFSRNGTEEAMERRRKQKIQQIGADYRQYLHREWKTNNDQARHQLDYNKYMQKK